MNFRLELALIAKHQFAGWGWQADVDVTPTSDDGHYYNEETASAQVSPRDVKLSH